ncbi:MAG: threonylcarbamoyl-AMP synthase [Lachnospiraceae bacterium]|nr:threonylcarbamoyl-AMP synthase [Lachnospiraceae bacterium]
METRWIRLQKGNTDLKAIREAGEIIRRGGLVAFPTETVYGLGGDALNPASSNKIYAAKGRPSDNPLIVHICRWEDLPPIVKEIPPQAKALADAFWPGPLTMIFQKSDLVPKETTGGLSTVAVRYPDHKQALEFIKAAGGYIAAPSANTSGRPSPTEGKYVYEDLSGKIEMLLDDGLVSIGLESTIVDLTEEIPVILRPGYITEEMLQRVLGEVCADPTILHVAADAAPKAPGMKYRHYAPKGDLTIVTGQMETVVSKVNALSGQAMEQGVKVGIIGTDETISSYQADVKKSVGKRTDEAAIARRLYQILREFDDENVQLIYSEAFDDTGIGQAIMNRLLKAAGHKVLTVT